MSGAATRFSPNGVHVALVANDRYRPGLQCTRHSMTKACREPERLVFHEFGDADMAPFLARIPLADYNGSKLPYLRLFLPELLPDCDWVLYSDVDTLWFKDPCELWDERDESVSVCWVKDLSSSGMDFRRWTARIGLDVTPSGAYACSGVTLINLKRWREQGLTERALDFLRRYGCPPYADQDVMNVLFAHDAKMLHPDWDVMIPPYFWRPCVLHVTGMGLRLFGSDHYDGNIAQYVFWFDYYRRHILGLPRMRRRPALAVRFALSALANLFLGPVLALLDRLPAACPGKFLLMRIRRQLGYARFGLGIMV